MPSGSKGGRFAPATASTTVNSIVPNSAPGAGSIKGGGTRLEQTYNEQLWREVEMQVRTCYAILAMLYSNHTDIERFVSTRWFCGGISLCRCSSNFVAK
jgi:hypothetical protein